MSVRASRTQRLRVPACVAGTLVAAAAWVLLVRAAIGFGEAAQTGDGAVGWLMTVLAGVGGVLCLLLVFVLLGRLSAIARAWRQRPARSPHRH